MINKDVCSFGKPLQKYWDRRYELFSRFDEGIQTDEVGLYSVTPESIALEQAKRMDCKTVIDGFAGIGGNAIAFARLCEKVYAIENDRNRMMMAKHNAKIYGVDKKIVFIYGDFFREIKKIDAEGIFLDPQWRMGPAYNTLQKFSLSDFEPDGNRIMESALGRFGKIAFKVPKQFELQELLRFGNFDAENNILNGRTIFRTAYSGGDKM